MHIIFLRVLPPWITQKKTPFNPHQTRTQPNQPITPLAGWVFEAKTQPNPHHSDVQ